MAGPIVRVSGNSGVPSTTSLTRAVEGQAKITGAASNYSLQSTMQRLRGAEEHQKAAKDLISLKSINAAQVALPTLRDMKRQQSQEEEEDRDDPRQPRREKRRRVPPIPHK